MYKLVVGLYDNGGINMYHEKDFWLNFVRHIKLKTNEYSVDIRNKELAKYKGHGGELGTGSIEFETEEDATMFVLMWS